ncbi:MAG: GTP cyclohydrolase I FolE2 [Xanthomonadales bacterium]|nr:GTP cyclohydrolase I FolE2 [Xanthomonadales bacterium]
MKTTLSTPALREMPDIAADARPSHQGTLDWVGMEQIEVPVLVPSETGYIRTPARVAAFVNLEQAEVRGIHMSRLYLHVDRVLTNEVMTPATVRQLLRDFLDSHQGLSDCAAVRVRYEHLIRRKALVSDKQGWKAYPVTISAQLDRGHLTVELATEVLYSSTCPCSAALARQLIQEQFERDFPAGAGVERESVLAWLGSEQGIVATPHSQRSRMQMRVRLSSNAREFPINALIDRAEAALATPVQTAVKREDEQAFARLNGANLMFCEDAGRRIQTALNGDTAIADFWARAIHMESLHPHDAVAVVTKGVAGGFQASAGWVEG